MQALTNMNRRTRFLLHALLPPPLGAMCLLVLGWIVESKRWGAIEPLPIEVFASVVLVILYAYCFAIIPSVLYAALMEFGYGRGILPGRYRALILSSLLGLLTGAIPILGSALLQPWTFSVKKALELSPWPLAGLLTGLLIEWWIGCLDRRRPLTP